MRVNQGLNVLGATLLTTLCGLSASVAQAEQVGRIYFENRSPDKIELRVTRYKNASGNWQPSKEGYWSFEPWETATLTESGVPLIASHVEFEVKSPHQDRTWTSAPGNFDKDGDLLIYHARPAAPVRYTNESDSAITLRCTSYVDGMGIRRTGDWTWDFVPGETARLLISSKPLEASRIEYTTSAGLRSHSWYNDVAILDGEPTLSASGGPTAPVDEEGVMYSVARPSLGK